MMTQTRDLQSREQGQTTLNWKISIQMVGFSQCNKLDTIYQLHYMKDLELLIVHHCMILPKRSLQSKLSYLEKQIKSYEEI